MTPAQKQRARALLSEDHLEGGELAELSVWRYPPSGLWVRWILVLSGDRYWVRRAVAQATGDDVVVSTDEVHLPTASIWPLFSGVSQMTLPLIPLEDDELPTPDLAEIGIQCGSLRLAWADGRLSGLWAPFADVQKRLVERFEQQLPPTRR